MDKRKVIEKINEAKEIIHKDENLAREYFEKVPTEWFDPLKEEGMLNVPESVYTEGSDQYYHHWIAGSVFLSRVIAANPEKVLNLLMSIDYADLIKNPVVISDLFKLVHLLSSSIEIAELLSKISSENWLKNTTNKETVSFTVRDIVHELVIRKDYSALSIFLCYVMKFLRVKRGEHYYTEPIIDRYQYKEILDEISVIHFGDRSALKLVFDALIEALGNYSQLEQDRKENFQEGSYNDYSFIWMRKVFTVEDEIAETAPMSLVRSITKLLEENKDLIDENILTSFSDKDFGVFKRIRIYGYSLIEPSLITEKSFLLQDALSDYHNLLEWDKAFVNISPLLSEGEKKSLVKYVSTLYSELKEDAVVVRGYVFFIIRKTLSDKERTTFKEFLEDAQEYKGSIELSTMKSGPNSPFSKNELAEMDVDEILRVFKESEENLLSLGWQNNLISPRGIARLWAEVIKEDPQKYIENINKFSPSEILPTYTSHLLRGLQASGIGLNFSLDYVENLADLIIADEVYKHKGSVDVFDVGTAKELLISLLRFFEDGFYDQFKYDKDTQGKIWEIIDKLRIKSSREDEAWIDKNGKDYYTHSLNSSSGILMHVLYKYMIWYVRNTDSKIPQHVINFIKKQNKEFPDSITIKSVEGVYLANFINNPFLTQLKQDLFPVENKTIRYVAWESFLSRGVYLNLISDLKEEYLLAISELGDIPVRNYWVNPEELLVEHIVTAYLNDSDDAKDLPKTLFSKEYFPSIVHMVSFIGRAFISSEKGLDPKYEKKILGLWRKILDKHYPSAEIYEQFGWWIKENTFTEEEKVLKLLLDTLHLSQGIIEPSSWVISALVNWVEHYDQEVAEILFEMSRHVQLEKIYSLEDSKILEIIIKLESSEKEECRKYARDIRHILIGKGFKQYIRN